MITEEEYLKAKQIVQEYEKQLNISDVISSVCEHERVDVPDDIYGNVNTTANLGH
jgi:hypothetical protein